MTPESITALSNAGPLGVLVIVVGMFLGFLIHRDRVMFDFLREQRESYSAALARIATEVQTSSAKTDRIEALLVRHDAQVESRLPRSQTGELRPQ